MRSLTAHEMLSVWERGRSAPLPERALLLLAHACSEISWDALAELPVGERDARLLTLREWIFGPAVSSVTSCPACGGQLELNFTIADVRVPAPALSEGPLSVEVDGYEVVFRLPNTADLQDLRGRDDPRDHLLRRCVVVARRGDRRRAASQLPAVVIDAVAERMNQADPQADVRTSITCPDCGHAWEAIFDIVSFFWSEIESWAVRMIREVHALASAYGWREADVLSMSPWRRQCYLQMVNR